MEIPNLRELNMCPLASWIRRYNTGEDKLWKRIVDCRYKTKDPNIFACLSDDTSPSGKRFYGLVMFPNWVIDGKWVRGITLHFGKIDGLVALT